MLSSPPNWPPPRPRVHCVSITLLSLHQLPSRRESRPLYEPHHRYVEKLGDVAEAPSGGSVSNPSLSVELFSLGGYHCTATELPPPRPGDCPTRVHSPAVAGNGLHPHFDLAVHCLAAEPDEAILRVSVQDGSTKDGADQTDAESASHSHDAAYEAVVLSALRPGYRCLPLRSRAGCRIDMCSLFVHIALSEVEVDSAPMYSSPMAT